MRRARAVGLGFGLAALVGLAGQATAPAQEAGGTSFIELFGRLDANDDKVIEKGEVPESGRAAFEQLLKHADTNRDGKIDREEYRNMLLSLREAVQRPGAGDAGAQNQFARMDTNKDGKISRDEFKGPEGLFDRIDADKDGAITREEARRFRAATVGAGMGVSQQARFRSMDTNGDGKVSRDEFNGPEAVFDRLDANEDGFLTREEAARFPAPGLGVGMMLRRLTEMDMDGDGKVSRKEFSGREAMFNRLDADKDGFVALVEADRVLGPIPGPGGGGGQDLVAARFREMDTNGDGKLSREEFPGPEARFDQIDADQDGFLTPAEVRQFFMPTAPAGKEAGAKEKAKESSGPTSQ